MISYRIYVELMTSSFMFPIFGNKVGTYEKIIITKFCFTGSNVYYDG